MPQALKYGVAYRRITLSLPKDVTEALENIRWNERKNSIPETALDLVVEALHARRVPLASSEGPMVEEPQRARAGGVVDDRPRARR